MSVGKTLKQQLQAMAGTAGLQLDTNAPLVVATGPITAQLTFLDYDRYSVTLRELLVGFEQPAAGDSQAYLSATAAEIVRRLSYLEEPLAVWELDGNEQMAQLRSSPPLREGEELSFWEVRLSAGPQPSARLSRFRWTPGMVERELIPYPATFALVARIADSMAEALQATAC